MKKNFKKIIFFFLITLLIYSFVPLPAYADVYSEIGSRLKEFNVGAQLPKASDPFQVVVNVINTLLSFLGLIFLIIVLYAGFEYMTAGGNAKKTEEAIKMIRDAIIGIAIVFVSYAFVNFVMTRIYELFQ